MKKLILSLLILQTLVAPFAQASDVRAYILRKSIWSGAAIMVDDKDVNSGFTGLANLSEAMKSNPDAAAFADRAHSDAVWANSFLFGGLAGALGYAALSTNFDAGTYWTIFFVGFLPGILFQNAAAVNLNKAINSYNNVGNPLAHIKPDRMQFVPTQDGGAVANLGWSF